MRAFPDVEVPFATLDSFSAFAEALPLSLGAFSASSYPPGTTNYSPATTMTQPAANAPGNFWQDNISGVVRAFTPAAVGAIGGSAAMQQYLQGNSPNMTLNQQGQLVPKPFMSTGMMIGIGAAAVGVLVLVMVMNKGKK